jgi:hypothetical protein
MYYIHIKGMPQILGFYFKTDFIHMHSLSRQNQVYVKELI